MFLSARLHLTQRGNVLLHRHHFRAGQLFDHRVAFHVIAMGVAAEQDPGVAEFESELFDVGLEERDRRLEVAINKDVALGRRDQKRSELAGAHEINVSDHLVRRKRLVPVAGLRLPAGTCGARE